MFTLHFEMLDLEHYVVFQLIYSRSIHVSILIAIILAHKYIFSSTSIILQIAVVSTVYYGVGFI